MSSRHSIPPSSLIYDPWLKAALKRRVLRRALAGSLLANWLISSFWATWATSNTLAIFTMSGWMSSSLHLRTIVFSILSWAVGSVPILIAKKRWSIVAHAPASSPKVLFCYQLQNPKARHCFLLLVVSSLSLSILHMIVLRRTGVQYVDSYWSMGVWAKARNHTFHLDGRFLYYILSQLVFACVVWFSDILRERYRLHLQKPSTDVSIAISQSIAVSAATAIVLTFTSTILSVLLFACFRGFIHPTLYSLPILRQLLRPFTAHFLKPRRTISYLWSHFGFILAVACENFTTGLAWEVPSCIFDVFSALPIKVCANTADPVLSMVSGVTSSDPYFQFHAFHELATIASSNTDSSRDMRVKIFTEAKYKPTLWETLLRQCLMVLGQDYQRLLRRGRAAPIPAAAKIEPPTALKNTAPAIRAPIFRSAQVEPLSLVVDAVSSDGAISSALTRANGAEIGLDQVSKSFTSVVNACSQTITAPLAVAKRKLIASIAGRGKALDFDVLQIRLEAVRTWWLRERIDRACYASLPNKTLDGMIVEVLCSLVVSSETEDTYGIVQKDVPRIIEALVTFLTALHEYQAELDKRVEGYTKEASLHPDDAVVLEECNKASDYLGGLITTLRNGLASIVFTYGDRLRAFSFPTHTAMLLQEFIDSLF